MCVCNFIKEFCDYRNFLWRLNQIRWSTSTSAKYIILKMREDNRDSKSKFVQGKTWCRESVVLDPKSGKHHYMIVEGKLKRHKITESCSYFRIIILSNRLYMNHIRSWNKRWSHIFYVPSLAYWHPFFNQNLHLPVKA